MAKIEYVKKFDIQVSPITYIDIQTGKKPEGERIAVYEEIQQTVTVITVADENQVRKDEYTERGLQTPIDIALTKSNFEATAKKYGIIGNLVAGGEFTLYEIGEPPQEEPPITFPPDEFGREVKAKKPWYIPKTKYRKAKSTDGSEFVYKEGKDQQGNDKKGTPYKGDYFQSSKGQFFTGKFPSKESEEIIREYQTIGDTARDLLTGGLKALSGPLFTALRGGYNIKEERKNKVVLPVIKRYFTQEPTTGEIVELPQQLYQELKSKVPNRKYVEIPWKTTMPAKDIKINGIIFKGSIRSNLDAVEIANQTMPGIKNYIKDYSYLLQEAKPRQTTLQDTYIEIEEITGNELENSRKANFDTKK